MSMPDKKSYRIWLNPEAPAKIENVRTQDFEEFSLKVWDYETEGWLYLPEEESKAIETQWISINPYKINDFSKFFRLSDRDFASNIEVDFRVTENSSIPSLRNILVLFNGIPGICLFDKFIPEECPDERIFDLVGSGQNISEGQFQNLSTWPNLRSLSLSHNKSLTNVDGLSGLTNLTSLNLDRCKSLTNVDGLSGLTNLTSLNLDWCKSLTNVDRLSGLTNLTSLNLDWCKSLTNVDRLSGLTNLTSLNLARCESLTNVHGLSGLTNLKSLGLRGCKSLTNVDGLSELKSLTSLDLSHCESLTNVDCLSGLTNLTSLNLSSCDSLTNVDCLSGLTNLTSLGLMGCDSLTNVDCLSGLTNLTSLNLDWCKSFTNVDRLSGLTNLTSLNLARCESLTSVDGLSGLTNLTSLGLRGCESLTNVDGLSELKSLTSLDLSHCESLTNVDCLSGLTNLTSLNLDWGKSLTNVDCLSGLTNLTSLDLMCCDSLTNVDCLSGLTNLTSLNLARCESLTSVDGLSGLTSLANLNLRNCHSLTSVDGLSGRLTNLKSLDLKRCKSLTNVDFLSGLTKLPSLDLGGCVSLTNVDGLSELTSLTSLSLSYCKSLTNVDGLSELTSLTSLDLSQCESLTNVDGLSGLKNLMSLNLTGCPYLKKINKLKSCSSLREFRFNDPVVEALFLSQIGQDDMSFVEGQAEGWLRVARKTPEPDELVFDLSETFGLYAKESWATDALSQLVVLMLSRNGSSEITWGSLLGAVAKCQIVEAQVILERVTDDMNQERASSVLRPLLKTLASLPESLSEWVNERADELLDSLSIEFLRDYGPSVCLFYARMGREDRLRSWLEKLTDPETPLWRDRIHLALGQREIGRGDLNSPRARLKEMSQGTSKDELLETLAQTLAKEKPLEAGELLDQISEEWRQATLSAELSEEAAFTEPAENAYRLLLHMERDPDKLADWVGALTARHPQSELAKEVARTFGAHETVNALPQLLSDLLEEEVIVKATKENQLKSFKEELMAEGEAESFLFEALVGRMCKRGLVNEEEAKQLLENLRGEKE